MKYNLLGIGMLALMSCNSDSELSDAYGNFESEDYTISALVPGELLIFDLEEGQHVEKGEVIGLIDTVDLHLQRLEIKANMEVISSQYQDLTAQINVLEAEKKNIEREIARTEKLVESNAATKRQLDDLEGKNNVVKEQMEALRAKNPTIYSQLEVSKAKMRQLDERISKSVLSCPTTGQVLNKIANAHQVVGPGSPLYTLADLSTITLRAYISGDQLSQVSLGQQVEVLVDEGSGLKSYEGILTWVSGEAEFTPKIIQTREERVDMVYAIKVEVKNDGFLKIGMPGEVRFAHAQD